MIQTQRSICYISPRAGDSHVFWLPLKVWVCRREREFIAADEVIIFEQLTPPFCFGLNSQEPKAEHHDCASCTVGCSRPSREGGGAVCTSQREELHPRERGPLVGKGLSWGGARRSHRVHCLSVPARHGDCSACSWEPGEAHLHSQRAGTRTRPRHRQALCRWLWSHESTLLPLLNFRGHPWGWKSADSEEVTSRMLYLLSWGARRSHIQIGTVRAVLGYCPCYSEGLASVSDCGMLFHITANKYRLWSASC